MTNADARPGLPESPDYFVAKLRELHDRMRNRLVAQLRRETVDTLSGVSDTRGGDTIAGRDIALWLVADPRSVGRKAEFRLGLRL